MIGHTNAIASRKLSLREAWESTLQGQLGGYVNAVLDNSGNLYALYNCEFIGYYGREIGMQKIENDGTVLWDVRLGTFDGVQGITILEGYVYLSVVSAGAGKKTSRLLKISTDSGDTSSFGIQMEPRLSGKIIAIDTDDIVYENGYALNRIVIADGKIKSDAQFARINTSPSENISCLAVDIGTRRIFSAGGDPYRLYSFDYSSKQIWFNSYVESTYYKGGGYVAFDPRSGLTHYAGNRYSVISKYGTINKDRPILQSDKVLGLWLGMDGYMYIKFTRAGSKRLVKITGYGAVCWEQSLTAAVENILSIADHAGNLFCVRDKSVVKLVPSTGSQNIGGSI